MTAPRIWLAESTNKGTSSFSANPNERRASTRGGAMSHIGKSGVLGISMAKVKIEEVERIKEEEVLKAKGGKWLMRKNKRFLYLELKGT